MVAKRRKYPLLNCKQLEDHLEMFTYWEQKLMNLGWSSDGIDAAIDTGWKEQHQNLRRWLDNYLYPYRERDKQYLVGTMLDSLYDEFGHINEEKDPDALLQWISGWLIETVTLYALFKPFMSSAQKLEYASPLRECFDIFQSQDPALLEPEVHRMVKTLCKTYL